MFALKPALPKKRFKRQPSLRVRREFLLGSDRYLYIFCHIYTHTHTEAAGEPAPGQPGRERTAPPRHNPLPPAGPGGRARESGDPLPLTPPPPSPGHGRGPAAAEAVKPEFKRQAAVCGGKGGGGGAGPAGCPPPLRRPPLHPDRPPRGCDGAGTHRARWSRCW